MTTPVPNLLHPLSIVVVLQRPLLYLYYMLAAIFTPFIFTLALSFYDFIYIVYTALYSVQSTLLYYNLLFINETTNMLYFIIMMAMIIPY